MHYSLRQYRAQAESHSHSDFHQIIISDLGKLELEIEGRGGEVCGRQMAFVEAGRTHAFRAEGLNRFLVLDIDIDLARQSGIEALWHRAGSASSYLELQSGRQGNLVGLLGGRSDHVDGLDEDGDTGAMLGHLRAIIGHSHKVDGSSNLDSLQMPTRLIRVTAWAETRLADDISITDMARIAAQSESSLFSAFQKHLGTSPMRWLTEQRLQTAWAMLQDDQIERSIADIALEVGFTDQSAFSRAFSRRFGSSPISVRRQKRSLSDA